MACCGVTVCALVLFALCACAGARPETAEAAPPSTTPTSTTPTKAATKLEEAEVTTAKTETTNDTASPANNETKAELRVIERFPHAVLFGRTCGGTIISPKWVITAGHCTIFTKGRNVLAGTDDSWGEEGVTRKIKRVILHPLFSVGPYWVNAKKFDIKQVAAHWDFMLAELEEPLPLDGKTMVAVKLDDQAATPEGLHVGYGGYGAENHGETMRSSMHGMELQVLPDSNCQKELVQFDPKDMLCTQGLPPRFDSACNGDSGSGLVANGTLYGVASWVQEDSIRCFNGALVVFSRVSAVRDWIRQVTKI